ncbi:MAG TPA: Calx-beta domain-containing protein, partial [Verrucomicrobiae bacterium]|nr:Calx-beta domain-containing protein [Verrucomicrobiae bacterium]
MNDCHPKLLFRSWRRLAGALLFALPFLSTAQVQTIEFSLPTFTTYENSTNAIVVVSRTGGADGTVTVNYRTLDGSALDVQDYIGVSGTLTFASNEVVKTIPIALVNSPLQEDDEVFSVVLSDPIGAVLGAQSTAQVVIFDDDTDIFFTAANYGILESGINAVIPIQRNPTSQGSASVTAMTFDGTATNTQDYMSVATNIVFTNFQALAYVYIPIINNCDVESNNLNLSIILTNVVGASIGTRSRATVTITNDDVAGGGTIQFASSGPISAFEGQFGAVRIPVERGCASASAVSVAYRVLNSTNSCQGTTNATSPSDFTITGGTSGVLSWGANDSADKTIDITLRDDLDVELPESIIIELSAPVTGGAVLGSNRVFTVIIADDDLPAGAGDFFYNPPIDNPSPGANNTVYAITPYESTASLTNRGRVIIGGDFTAVNAIVRGGVARLNVDGTVDTTFDSGSGADGFVGAVVILPDDRVLIAGGFGSVDNISRRGIARLDRNGALDPNFNPGAGADGPIFAMSLLQDGRLLIAGDFTSYNNVPRRSIARLNGDGSLDTTFDPPPDIDGPVYSIAQQADGRVLIGGSFNVVDNVPISGIARLETSGNIDLNFSPIAGANDTVYTLAIQNDGRIIAGGAFSTYDGEPRRGLVRVNSNGSLDNSFNPGSGVEGLVYSIDLQSNGQPIIGGDFAKYNGTARNNLARLYANGTLDTTFLDNHYNNAAPGLNGFVAAVRFLQDTNVLVGGNFSRVGVGFSLFSIIPRNNYAKILGGTTLGPGNAPGNFEFATASYSADENILGGLINIRVRRLNGNVGDVEVPYFTVDGSARDGVDYIGGPGVVRFNDCEPFDQLVSIRINDNNTVDGNRTFRIVLGAPQSLGPTIINSPALGFITVVDVTIVDNDFARGTLGFANAIYSVNESVGTANITVTRTNGSVGRVTVQYATSNGSAIAGVSGDYTATSDTLTFEPGQTVKTFPISIRNDTASEFEETVNLALFNVTGGASLGRSNAVLLINSDETGPGSISFSTNEFTVNEAAGSATITLRRTSGSAGKIFVDVLTMDRPPGPGAAREGVDYTGFTNTITFQAGETSQSVTVPILADGLVEGIEFLNLVLTNVTGGANLGYLSTSALKIADDDYYGSLAFTDANLYVNEQDSHAAITVVRTGGSAEEVSVDFVVTMETATEGVDYVATNGTLVFPAGSLSQTFNVPMQDDAQLEVNETIVLTLTNFAKASPGPITDAVLTIIDDEALAAPAGSVDTFFDPNPGPNGFVNAIALLNDGRLFAAGDFTVFNNIVRRRIVRLNTDGSVDTSFNPGGGADDTINAMALQADEKVLVGGRFTRVGNRNRNGIARLNQNGAVDTSFNPGSGADNPVLALAVDGDGSILVGGDFTTYNNTPRSRVARLNPDGSLDTGFNPGNGANGAVQALAIQSDGKIIVAGDFSEFDNQSANFIVRLN